MRILLLGNRAIQHALYQRLVHEGCAVEVYPGLRASAYRCVSAEVAMNRRYDLVVVGSARYFSDPVVIELRTRGVSFFGPDPEAALLESSKWAFKEFATEAGIPFPRSRRVTNCDEARRTLETFAAPYVIKADGPARGCGVAICRSLSEANDDLETKLHDSQRAAFAGTVVVEEFVEGFELGVNVIIDGTDSVILPPTRPHKRRYVNDSGPIVAGMGSVAPIRLGPAFHEEIHNRILVPTLRSLRRQGRYFRGCLFINLMLTEHGLQVLEFNCRMGDPAMLVDLLLLQSSLVDLLECTAAGRLRDYSLRVRQEHAVAVTLVHPTYPDESSQTMSIKFDPTILWDGVSPSGIVIAGGERVEESNALMFSSGVILAAIARAPSLDAARTLAYATAAHFPQLDSRPDIALHVAPLPKYGDSLSVEIGRT